MIGWKIVTKLNGVEQLLWSYCLSPNTDFQFLSHNFSADSNCMIGWKTVTKLNGLEQLFGHIVYLQTLIFNFSVIILAQIQSST
jgi:hypothetical protein